MASKEDQQNEGTAHGDSDHSKVRTMFAWINRHIGVVGIVLVLAAVVFGIMGPLIADTDEPHFSPSAEIDDTEARAEEVFASSSPIRDAGFLIDEPNVQDVLTQAALLEFLENPAGVRSNPDNTVHLASVFDQDLGVKIAGVFSLADAVDATLPSGLAGATH
jgi:hypothetical protein